MKEFAKKLTSRKFILAVLSAIGGAAISLSSFEGKVGAIAAVIAAIVPAITYIVTEGIVDAKAVGLATKAIQTIAGITDGEDKPEEEIQG